MQFLAGEAVCMVDEEQVWKLTEYESLVRRMAAGDRPGFEAIWEVLTACDKRMQDLQEDIDLCRAGLPLVVA